MTRPLPLRTMLLVLFIVGGAGAATWWLTRKTAAPAAADAAAPAGHNHGAMAGAETGERPVHLSDADQRRIGVTFAPVVAGPLERDVRVVAQVAYDERRITVVTPRVEGYVERLFANIPGQQVRAGAPLLELHAPMLSSTAAEYLLARRLERDLAGGTAEARADASRLAAAARARLALWGVDEGQLARLDETGEAPHSFTLRAAASGVVLEKYVVEGQRVMMGEPLFRLADIGTVWLEGDVFEQDLGAARVGTEVMAEFPALPGDRRRGRITFVAPTLNLETHTGRIRVALPNPGLALKPGMFATLHFSAPATGRVLSVPRSAVLSTGQRNLVFLKRPDGRFTPTDVTLGVQTETRVAVLSGLMAGDTVVASATFLVDAESNLGSLLGGMGDMPGMDLTAPASGAPASGAPRPAGPPPAPAPAAPDHSGHGS